MTRSFPWLRFLPATLLAACGGGAGTVAVQDLSGTANPVRTAAVFIPQGDTRCPYGGAEIRSGIDQNGNGVLDADEVAATDVVCNGEPGLTSLIRLQDEPPGEHCPGGGVRLQTGPDQNRNGELDDAEIDPAQTRYLCHGQPGRDGTDGRDAIPTLVALDPIAPGADCPAGGTAILTGPDTNGNGLLDPDEVQSTRPVCNGRDGAGNAVTGLFAITDEPPGANCPAGGTRIDFGLDTDSDGTLSLTEVTQTGYVCNGQDGLGSQAISTIYCAGGLENFPGMSWDYQVQQLANGDVVATASVTDNYITTSRTQYYSLFQVGFLEAPIQLTTTSSALPTTATGKSSWTARPSSPPSPITTSISW